MIIPNFNLPNTTHFIQGEYKCTGRRIFGIDFLFKQMKSFNEHIKRCPLADLKLVKETKKGLISVFHFQCSECEARMRINTSPPKKGKSSTTNEAAVLGMNSVGLGFYHLEEFFAHLDVPSMCYSTYNTINKEQQDKWWQLAKESTEKALQEEIMLARLNGDVDSSGNVYITVVCDGSWGKRSYGTNYSSLSGMAAIVGLRTKKVIYFDVRNKYCHTCKIAYSNNTPPNYHECNINHYGPSSSMETDIIVEGFKSMERRGVRIPIMISDGDASTFKAIRDLRLYTNPDIIVEKYECCNHLFKNFRKQFKALKKDTKFTKNNRDLISLELGNVFYQSVIFNYSNSNL